MSFFTFPLNSGFMFTRQFSGSAMDAFNMCGQRGGWTHSSGRRRGVGRPVRRVTAAVRTRSCELAEFPTHVSSKKKNAPPKHQMRLHVCHQMRLYVCHQMRRSSLRSLTFARFRSHVF